ncbi:MAG: nitroreductase family protein [Pseudomonadota bacterium]|nr:nitroreductase family protein [Pseudomonadota bacterium]
MPHSFKIIIESRTSTNYYDTSRPLPDSDITELLRLATLAPSAYNLQNWKFIAVRSPEAKARLKAVSCGQQKVVDAPVTFIICGILAAYEGLSRALQPSVEAGILNQSTLESWVATAKLTHADNPQLQRDEAFRSASLAAMTLMFAAQGMGLSSGPISGFDPLGVVREFGLSAAEVPVILVTVGYPVPGNWPQKPRKPLHEVITFS